MKSRAHISFRKFIDEEEPGGQISDIMCECLELIKKGIGRLPSFNLFIDGFGFFNHGQKFKTIYAAIELDIRTKAWLNAIKEQLLIDGDITPHITIARKIPVESFNILWPYFQQLEFKASFKPDCLTVLRREVGKPYVPYKKFAEFEFNPCTTIMMPAELTFSIDDGGL
jgi:2'-5' RNA ligase